MAEKTVTVRLRALVDDYRRAMAGAGKATADVANQARRWQTVGQSASELGGQLTRGVTVPVIAAGAAATKMAVDFDQTFAQMQGLAGVAAGEVDGLRESVMALAGETGRGPQELAEALYFIRSSGLEGAAALDALEVSAKASASGLGSTQVVADAVTSAMNGYAKSGLSAADATDVLVATARAGKAEPAELAAQMGRLIPLSSELGITFQDVGAAIASLSLSGNDAAASSTLLSNVMSKLLKPSQQATEQLEAAGGTVDGLREEIAEKGLLGTLESLRARLGDAGFVKFLEDAQAVQGGLALTGQNVEANRQIFEDLANSTGAAGDAFDKTDSKARTFAQAWAKVQVAMIRFGDLIAPVVADLADLASAGADAFSDLPDGAQRALLYLGLVAAAAGPTVWAIGKLVTTGGQVASGMRAVRDGLYSVVVPAGSLSGALDGTATRSMRLQSALRGLASAATVATGIGILVSTLKAMGDAADAAHFDELVGKLNAGVDDSDEAVRKLVGQAAGLGELEAVLERLAATSMPAAEQFVDVAESMGLSGSEASALRDRLGELQEQEVEATRRQAEHSESVSEAAGVMGDLGEETANTTSAMQDYLDLLKAQTDPIFAAMDAMQGQRDAQVAYQDALIGVTEAQTALDEAIANHGANSAEAAEAQRGLEEAQRGVTDAQWGTVVAARDADAALAGLKAAVDNNDVSFEQFSETLATWVRQGFITQGQADAAALSVMGLAGEADNAASKRVDIPVRENGAPRTRAELHGVRDAANSIPPRRDTTVRAHDNATGLLDRVIGMLNRVSDRSATVTVTHRTIFDEQRRGHTTSGPQLRASGGPVWRGQPYWVGERGPELMWPEADGRIMSHQDSMAMVRSARNGDSIGGRQFVDWAAMTPAPAGGGATYVDQRQISITTGAEPQQVVEALRRWDRTNGPLPVRVR